MNEDIRRLAEQARRTVLREQIVAWEQEHGLTLMPSKRDVGRSRIEQLIDETLERARSPLKRGKA